MTTERILHFPGVYSTARVNVMPSFAFIIIININSTAELTSSSCLVHQDNKVCTVGAADTL